MLKELILKITTLTLVFDIIRAALPEGSVSKFAERIFGLIEILVLITPIAGFIYGHR